MFRLFQRKKLEDNVENKRNNEILLNLPSVAVYKDFKTSLIYIIPSVINPIGCRSTNYKFIKLVPPYTDSDVGKVIREAIQISIAEPYLPKDVKGDFWVEAEGVKSMVSFIRTKLLINVTYNVKENSYQISTMKKYKTTGYTHSKNDPEYLVDVSVNDHELGHIVLNGFNECK
ncbi:hypothetical protein GCM10008018_43170 [Paenibacillus marchantiophytorum]|uniref:Uncharacterized protein n=1 Tax=Paenibacillus marchantiophytorum TaxID=1619310 RepID=A0ABQ1EXQ8_9BACL|nr:hypothetical protein [Paenibacillus marchantiophytorum]GFZ92254.1 hypothetical protein GCM10008018_43170 [Paenibacillus marchantiophytorum]